MGSTIFVSEMNKPKTSPFTNASFYHHTIPPYIYIYIYKHQTQIYQRLIYHYLNFLSPSVSLSQAKPYFIVPDQPKSDMQKRIKININIKIFPNPYNEAKWVKSNIALIDLGLGPNQVDSSWLKSKLKLKLMPRFL